MVADRKSIKLSKDVSRVHILFYLFILNHYCLERQHYHMGCCNAEEMKTN